MQVTDVTVMQYSASRDPRRDPGGIQIVDVHTDAGTPGRGFVARGSRAATRGTLIRRKLRAVVAGENPLLGGPECESLIRLQTGLAVQ